AVYPRAFFTGPVAVKPAESAFKATATPNINIYMPLTGLPADSSYVNPITKTSEFGPYPATMSGRNRFRGPGAWNIDGGIYKNTRINERVDTQLRLEMYNSMNHANLFVDSGSVDMSFNEYVPASRSGNRNIQLALKIIF
ncbi:MAG TPA: hypothetical protein DEH78_30300, partial [Solibacterales bacterium]|nr:hypothetical protein [Bryobacterales bacterium]